MTALANWRRYTALADRLEARVMCASTAMEPIWKEALARAEIDRDYWWSAARRENPGARELETPDERRRNDADYYGDLRYDELKDEGWRS
jgi:hypothetical protein